MITSLLLYMHLYSLTLTPDPSISSVGTVALVEEVVTLKERGLIPSTENVIEQYGTNPLTKVCSRECQCSYNCTILANLIII